MKKNIVFALMVILSLGLSTALTAQGTAKKKKKPAKKHKTTKTAKADTTAAPVMEPEKPVAVAPAIDPDDIVDTTHSDGLVADPGTLDYLKFKLDSTRPVDGMYKIPVLRGAKAFPFPTPNKNNIKFYKRIWRIIDLTDSVNRIFAAPGETMMSFIMEAIKAEKIIAYKDEGFLKRLSYRQVMRAFSDSSIVPVIDSLTGEQTGMRTVVNPFNPDSITKFELKEDIFYDKIHSKIITEIVGLAPIRKVKSSDGVVLGEQHPFYLYFPQCRTLFAGKEIYDTQRDIYNVSYDDIFATRNFNTIIVKESNPGDLRIKDKYPDEADQKKEAERIEQGIRDYKKNLWKY
ncbi:MAG: gliding motility protein GldN [Flavipsychrobacter sp.]|nr:gliding motility protein GldN [Flavipsychrobacter sp.]